MEFKFKRFDVIDVINDTWELFKAYLGMALAGWLLAMVANMVIAMGVWFLNTIVDVLLALTLGISAGSIFEGLEGFDGDFSKIATISTVLILKISTQIFFQIIQTALSMFVTAGVMSYYIQFVKNETPPDLKALIVFDKRVWHIFLFQFLLGLIISVIVFVCVAPGGVLVGFAIANKISYVPAIVAGSIGITIMLAAIIYVQLSLSQALYFIVDKRVGPIDAFTLSIEAMKGNKLSFFILGILVGAISVVIMVFTCFIGSIFVIPFSMLLMARVYVAIIGEDFIPEQLESEALGNREG